MEAPVVTRDKYIRLALAAADAALQSAQASVSAAHALLAPPVAAATPVPTCAFCKSTDLADYEGDIIICKTCNTDQAEG